MKELKEGKFVCVGGGEAGGGHRSIKMLKTSNNNRNDDGEDEGRVCLANKRLREIIISWTENNKQQSADAVSKVTGVRCLRSLDFLFSMVLREKSTMNESSKPQWPSYASESTISIQSHADHSRWTFHTHSTE
jgi:hypothetical protein